MPGHVTFIHGIGNQQSPDSIVRSWKRSLADGGDGVDLDTYGVTASMVYWADVMYEEPSDVSRDNESVLLEGITKSELPGVDESYLDTSDTDEQAFLAAMAETYNLDADEDIPVPDISDVEAGAAHTLEAMPLPWFVKKPLMRIFLRDVHHYLFNTSHTPRTGETFEVQNEIRRRYVADLAAVDSHPHIVIAHSMGTVMSYDVLKRVSDSKAVDALFTLGSPLGLSEIQDQMGPEWTKDNGFPAKVGAWMNFADGLDPVCGADPKLANEYQRKKDPVVDDVMVTNNGLFRHPVSKYMRQKSFQDAVRAALGV